MSDSRQHLSVEKLKKYFVDDSGSTVRAVDGVTFSVKPGEFYTLLGPSGCGKTTTLRSVAGLETCDDGRIALGGDVLSEPAIGLEVPPNHRGLGMVFQSYAIWPHMTVYANVAFPLEISRPSPSKSQIREMVEEALSAVELSGYEARMATQLSGGQQQRLALARALVAKPRVLLLDEPLSNLDAKLRSTMRAELRRLQRDLGITTLYVTHDQMEALSMSNRIAVMRDGRIVQEDTPEGIYRRPTDRFVAEFVGNMNFLSATLERKDHSGESARYSLDSGGVIVAPCLSDMEAGERVTIAVRYEAVGLDGQFAGGNGHGNTLEGKVAQIMFLGDSMEFHVGLAGGVELLVRANPSEGVIRPGDQVAVHLPAEECIVISEGLGVASSIELEESIRGSSLQ